VDGDGRRDAMWTAYIEPMPHHDLVIIGTGSGNTLLTPELEGLDVAIVEEGVFGGTCLNVGCIPTKMYVLPADRIVEAREAERLGAAFGSPAVDWSAIRDRIFGRIDPIAQGGEDYRRSQDDVTVYAAHTRFTGVRRLALDSGEEVTGDRFVVAAGSRPNGLPIDGLREADPENGLHTSDTIMRIDALPPRMIVLGGGFVACEFAHVFSALGVEVTQVQRSATVLVKEETEVAERYTQLARERYDLRTATGIEAARRTPDGVWSIDVRGPQGPATSEAEVVLLAVGRTPNSDLLDAAAGGLEIDERTGRIVVDEQQRTSVEGVWALGDISSPWQLKHVANHEARVVAHNLAVATGRLDAEPETTNHEFVPHGVFGHPQIAAFGPTRAELEAAGTAYVSRTQSFGDVAYGWALEDHTGFLTVHASAVTRRVLAAHCLGPMATTVIQPLIQAAAFGQDVHDVARGQYWIHPALAEVVENALLGLELSPPDAVPSPGHGR
jgi:mycothione reductase